MSISLSYNWARAMASLEVGVGGDGVVEVVVLKILAELSSGVRVTRIAELSASCLEVDALEEVIELEPALVPVTGSPVVLVAFAM